MAAPALPQPVVDPSNVSMGFLEIYSGPLAALPISRRESSAEKTGVYVSPAASLRCAKGAMMAIGIEMAAAVAAVLCLYGASRL